MANFLDTIGGLSFAQPTWQLILLVIFLAAAIGALVLFARRSRLMMPAALRLALVVVTGVTLLLLTMAYGELTHTKKEKHLAVTLLVDGSASIPDEQFDLAKRWLGEAYGARGESWARTVVFGREPQILNENETGAAPNVARPEQKPGTNIARALHAALEIYPQGHTRRAVLLTDGNQTDGDLLEQAALAADHGVELFSVVLDTRADRDIYVESIHVPAAARPGERVKVGVIVVANYATPARLSITQGGASVFNQTVNVEPGRNAFETEATVRGRGGATFVANVSAEEDQHPENDRLSASLRIADQPRAVLFSAKPDADLALVEALADSGLSVQVADADALPSGPSALYGYDEVILSDIEYKNLSAAQQKALMDYVREGGGGLLVLGGDNTGSLGKIKEKLPIKRMMPVVFKEKKKTEPNPVTLILVIDKSASMARQRKFAMAVQAACDTIDQLTERSRIGVILFDDFPRWAIPLQKVGDNDNKKKMKDRLRTFGVDGGTSIYPAVSEAYKTLKNDEGKVKHIMLLSDGISITTFDQWGHIIQWMASKKITISTVALGSESDQPHLRKIAEVGRGRYYYTEDFSQIPRIFLEETKTITKTNIVEKKIKPALLKRGDLLQKLKVEPIPELVGYNSSEPKPTSEVFMTADRGEPLLARWRYGLGKVTVLLTDSGFRWARSWRQWKQYAPLMARLVRGTLPDLALRNYRIAATTVDDQARVTVDATDQYGNYANDMTLQLKVTDPEGESREFELNQTRPGGYEGEFDVEAFGSYSLRVAPQGGAAVRSQGVGQVNLAPPREFVATMPDRALLGRVAAVGRGKVNPTPAEVFAEPETEFPHRRGLWDGLLYGVLGMLLIGVIIRRS